MKPRNNTRKLQVRVKCGEELRRREIAEAVPEAVEMLVVLYLTKCKLTIVQYETMPRVSAIYKLFLHLNLFTTCRLGLKRCWKCVDSYLSSKCSSSLERGARSMRRPFLQVIIAMCCDFITLLSMIINDIGNARLRMSLSKQDISSEFNGRLTTIGLERKFGGKNTTLRSLYTHVLQVSCILRLVLLNKS